MRYSDRQGEPVMRGYTARLFGGHEDGAVVTVDHYALISALHVPVPTPVDVLMEPPPDPFAIDLRVDVYVWDGTVNEAGEHRFRWRYTNGTPP